MRAARVDANHKAIVEALRRAGCAVLSLAAVGQGVPDLLVYVRGRLWLLEIKDGEKAPSRRKLTEAQERFRQVWPVELVESVDEALLALGLKSS